MFSSIALISAVSLFPSIEALPRSRSSIPSDRTISWRSCPEVAEQVREANPASSIPLPFDCASLTVPLDYTNTSAGTLDLALIKVNASEQPALGSVLWNPGGPGSTGTENLAIQSEDLLKTLGGRFDIISWDFRGTGKTLPFDCNLTSWNGVQRRDVDSLVHANVTERFLRGAWEEYNTVAELCYSGNEAIGDLIGTAFTAHDAMQIVDALDEDGLIRYWGTSYGSYLGAVIAKIFPDRVGRLLIDAIFNPWDFSAGHFGNYLIDADKVMLAFLEECVLAGESCDLVRHTGLTTAEGLLGVLNTALEPILENATSTYKMAEWTPYFEWKQLIYQQLYFPRLWSSLAATLTTYLNGTAATAAASSAPTPKPYNLGPQSINGIRCSDALWRADSPEQILDQVKYQATVSEGFSDVGYESTWLCAAWKFKAKEQVSNFNAKTRFPILMVGGAWDVATPLVSAFNTSAGFEGSVVLTHNGYGHGITSHRSTCTDNIVKRYFEEGVLPRPGTICQPDEPRAWRLKPLI